MKLNGVELTQKEELNLLRREKRSLEKQVITEAVHNELKYLNGRIHRISTQFKIERLELKAQKTRNAKEYGKICNQITKLQESILISHFNKKQ